ncbi:MAG: hypothetical protein ACJ73E_05795 [Mycobacteriales bacterium]
MKLREMPAAAASGWPRRSPGWCEAALAETTILLPDEALLRTCAWLRAEAARVGHPLAHRSNANDVWIAASAAHHRLPLVTGNVRHFAGLPELVVVAPEGVR